ncbi:thermonuclease family protein [Synechococcales cyanobacterium C]|uniref:Thermonuclease family protein n=1 Tax=Petrachloros mirabilis ULC683 TaxID=2781853 RepID=A0A8K2A6X0_9CYAN|nr:thermonuclease family protein [Petrachloros mirabilis]NCJ06276.1 thermonuclease family protein [Petrachloros mirabilis ULC683]
MICSNASTKSSEVTHQRNHEGEASGRQDALPVLIDQAGGRVRLNLIECDRYGRHIAEVYAGGELTQQVLLRMGMAYVYPQYVDQGADPAALKEAESLAQQQGLGVWSALHQKPWEFRTAN